MFEYVRANDLSRDQIEAGAADGTLQPWREGEAGEMWYTRRRKIRGLAKPPGIVGEVPADELVEFDDDDDLDDDLDADDLESTGTIVPVNNDDAEGETDCD